MSKEHGAEPKKRPDAVGEAAQADKAPPVSIKAEWCKACGICVEFCPLKVFDTDEESCPVIARPEACSLCRICEQLCPDFAIRVRRDKEREPDK